jgi:hypothetical protein
MTLVSRPRLRCFTGPYSLGLTVLIACSGTIAAASPACAQDTAWISQFGTVEFETSAQVAGDANGGVFVATNSGPQIFGTTDVILANFDADGLPTWSRTIGSSGRDQVWDAISDGSGGFFACGSTDGDLGGPPTGSFDAWIGKFDALGTEIWMTQFGSTSLDSCLAVAPDGAGGVFACGRTQGLLAGTSSTASDAWLARFDATGTVTWIRQFDSGLADSASGIAVDGSGGVYVSGDTRGDLFGINAGDADAWAARFDGSGNSIWGLQWGSSDSESSIRVTRNAASGVFVGGSTSGLLGITNEGGVDVWLTRISEAGVQSWIRQLGTPDNETSTAVASDLSGGVYLTGGTLGALGETSFGGLDPWVARYDESGERSWLRQIGTPGTDRAGGIAVTQPGQLFVGGSTSLAFAGVNEGGEDAWVASFDSLLSENYCFTAANSTGVPAVISAGGSSGVAVDRLTVRCESLPSLVFGYFIVSSEQGFAGNPAGSQGNLCLDGSIGRFVGPGEVQNSGLNGVISLDVDPTSLPQPLGAVAAQPGETWNFQAWFRDGNPQVTSNFSNGLTVTFL